MRKMIKLVLVKHTHLKTQNPPERVLFNVIESSFDPFQLFFEKQ